MARPASFDRDEKLKEAMRLFWRQGYEATSVQDLVDHLGLNRSSLYNAFGGKHDLYLEALDHYRRAGRRALQQHLREAPTPIAGIRHAFEAVAAQATERQWGCFVANAAVECAPRDPDTEARAADTFEEMRALFREAVEQAQAAGTIASTRDPEALGRSLTNAFYGLHLTAKTNPPPSVVDDIVDETIRGLTGPSRSPEAA